MENIEAKLILSSKYLKFPEWKRRWREDLRMAWGRTKTLYGGKINFRDWCQEHYLKCQDTLDRINLY